MRAARIYQYHSNGGMQNIAGLVRHERWDYQGGRNDLRTDFTKVP